MNSELAWKATWDWVADVWGPDPSHTLNAFFRSVASIVAEREQWEEVGSSDVWHASFGAVQRAQTREVMTRVALIEFVCDYQEIWGTEKALLVLRFS